LQIFIIVCCAYPFRAMNICLIDGIYRAGGDTVFCAGYVIVPMWVFSLPLGAIACFIFNAPIWIIYGLILLEHPVKITIGALRFNSGKWLHNVIKGVSTKC